MLQKHLDMSVQEMKALQSHIKEIIKEYMEKTFKLEEELTSIKRVKDYQDFEMEKLYEMLRKKKEELEMCYEENAKIKRMLSHSPKI